MKDFFKFGSLVLIGALALAACSSYSNKSPMPSVSDDARRELKQPVNCTTARSDIRVLEEEKASIAKQALSGVRSVLPIAAVAGLLMGDYSDRVEVATGQYNNDIDKKITVIRAKCGIHR